MTTRNGTHRPGDPVAAARPGVETPVRQVVTGRPGPGDRAGLVAVAVVAITVVAAGLGLVGGGTGPAPSDSPSPAATVGRMTSAPSSMPAASGVVEHLPTELPGSDCRPVTAGMLPEIRLWATSGESPAAAGVPVPMDRALQSPPTAPWPVPDPAVALILDRAAMIVLIPEAGCIRVRVAEYLGVDDIGGPPISLGLAGTNMDPPRARVVLGSIPRGDWVVHVVASYSVGVTGSLEAVIERFFRVTSGLGADATPLVSPAVPCGPLAIDRSAPRLYLAAGDAEPVLGVDAATYPGDLANNGAIVTATFPLRLEVRVAGDACATSWTIEIRDRGSGSLVSQTIQDNLGQNPYSVSQNRIELMDVPLGPSVVWASVVFGRGRIAQAAWELSLNGPPVPAAEVIGPNGDRAAALPGTCISWTIAGRFASAYCDQPGIPQTLEQLDVKDGNPVRIVVPGWEITSWNVSCGNRISQPGGFAPVAGCSLGGGGEGSGPAEPALFLPFPGRTTVVAWLSARQGDATVLAPYYIDIDARP